MQKKTEKIIFSKFWFLFLELFFCQTCSQTTVVDLVYEAHVNLNPLFSTKRPSVTIWKIVVVEQCLLWVS